MITFCRRGLQKTPQYRSYSFRHSFEKRMREANIDYDHALTNVAPYLRARGVAENDLQAILVSNPARLLQFRPSVD